MNGRIFGQALFSLHGKDLRIIYILCCDTGIMDLLGSKIQDLLPGDTNHFIQKLEEKVTALQYRSDEDLQLQIVLEMAKRMDLRGAHLSADQELEEYVGQIIIIAERRMAEQDSHYKGYKNNNADAGPLQSMVHFQLDQLLQLAVKEIDSASADARSEYVQKVEKFIQAMPEEKQTQIKQQLGVDKLTNEMLQRIVATSGASVLFAAIVEVSGFAFYTTATSLLASLAGLFGVTLSFGTYTALTSFVAVLASPIFLLLLLGGGGFFLYRSQNQKLQNKMLPILILQITLPFLSGQQEIVSYTPLITLWKTSHDQYQILRTKIRDIERTLEDGKKQIASLTGEIRSKEQTIFENNLSIENAKAALKTKLIQTDLEQLQVSNRFTVLAARYIEMRREAGSIRHSKQYNEAGLMGWIRDQVKSVSNHMDLSELQRRQNELLNKLLNEVLAGTQEWGREERERIYITKQHNQDLRHHIVKLQRERADYELQQERQQTTLTDLRKEQKSYELRIYGLEHI
ncbi:hypothetical protein [Paenibacillus sp. FSL R5-0912]|uniref:hypothetical protein n=1 Tax=Paenibacillus sp. FSL R5-0912 TaxID=1536771 RepID=UPI0004F66228|nr:hypothetical protein [Paenibacillus sp. FSL R5-0912]AIQ39920.1 hypothetical protein R50912_07685 [Paenibacillus sp. FSL R5-0912]